MIFLHLFNGRSDPNSPKEDWDDEDGVFIGPLRSVNMTFLKDLRIQDTDESEYEVVPVNGDLIFYDGTYYGDFSIVSDVPSGENWDTFEPEFLEHDGDDEDDEDGDEDEESPQPAPRPPSPK